MTAPVPHEERAAGVASPSTVPLAAVALITGGFISIALTWRGAAAVLDASLQVPFAVSGGAGGLALVITGVAIAYVHASRVAMAIETAAIEDLHEGLASVTRLALVASERSSRASRRERRAARRAARSARGT